MYVKREPGWEGSKFIMKNDLLLAQTQKIIKLCLWSEWNMNLNGEQLLSMQHGCERVINILSSVLVQQFLCMTCTNSCIWMRKSALRHLNFQFVLSRDLIRRIRCFIWHQLLLEKRINYFKLCKLQWFERDKKIFFCICLRGFFLKLLTRLTACRCSLTNE